MAKLDVDKTVAIPDGKGTAAVGDKLEYTVTITSLNSVAATDVIVTDTMWESDSSVKIGGKDGTLQYVSADGKGGYYVTVDVPADDTVVIYYTYTVPETDAGNSVGNAVTVGEMTATTSTRLTRQRSRKSRPCTRSTLRSITAPPPSTAARLQALSGPPRARTSPSPSPRTRATLWIMPKSMAKCC